MEWFEGERDKVALKRLKSFYMAYFERNTSFSAKRESEKTRLSFGDSFFSLFPTSTGSISVEIMYTHRRKQSGWKKKACGNISIGDVCKCVMSTS